MKIKGLVAEDFVNYKLPSMFIITSTCNWKCCHEQGLDISICQNASLSAENALDISPEKLYNMYSQNPITEAIVFGGLEPLDQINEVLEVIEYFRKMGDNSPFIIYTGYYPNEVTEAILRLKTLSPIVVKYGRFIPNAPHRYDEVLGVELVSDNQFAEEL